MLDKLQFRLHQYTFDFDLAGKITTIMCDSAAGKSFFAQCLKSYTAVTTVPQSLPQVRVYDIMNRPTELRHIQNSLIVIDNFDVLSMANPQLKELVLSDSNQYILIGRTFTHMRLSHFSIRFFKMYKVFKDSAFGVCNAKGANLKDFLFKYVAPFYVSDECFQ